MIVSLVIRLQEPALAALQRRCSQVGLQRCGWHTFRRGAAQETVDSGEPLGTVLYSGGWRSGAFLRYISREALDTRAAFAAAIEMSDED